MASDPNEASLNFPLIMSQKNFKAQIISEYKS